MNRKISAVIAIILVVSLVLVYGISFVGAFRVEAAPSKSE